MKNIRSVCRKKVYKKVISLAQKLSIPERKRLIKELYIDLYFDLYDQYTPTH